MQADLFSQPGLPDGFRYRRDLISAREEEGLLDALRGLAFKEFEFHGFVGKRRVISFGWRYDFNRGGLQETEPMPPFLLALREQAAMLAGMPPERLQQVLLTEYGPGAAIGWHKDRSVFGEVVGFSLLSACTFRLRRKSDHGWERASVILDPRSGYVLQGPVRTDWEHSIPAVEHLRYSITFRNIADAARRRSAQR